MTKAPNSGGQPLSQTGQNLTQKPLAGNHCDKYTFLGKKHVLVIVRNLLDRFFCLDLSKKILQAIPQVLAGPTLATLDS